MVKIRVEGSPDPNRKKHQHWEWLSFHPEAGLQQMEMHEESQLKLPFISMLENPLPTTVLNIKTFKHVCDCCCHEHQTDLIVIISNAAWLVFNMNYVKASSITSFSSLPSSAPVDYKWTPARTPDPSARLGACCELNTHSCIECRGML